MAFGFSSLALSAASTPKPTPGQTEIAKSKFEAGTTVPDKKQPRLRKTVIRTLAVLGIAFVLDATMPQWFPWVEQLTAKTVVGQVVDRTEALKAEVSIRDSETGEYRKEVHVLDGPILIFAYKKLGIEGIADQVVREITEQGFDIEVYNIDEELFYEIIVFDDFVERDFEVDEEVYDSVKRGKTYRFKVSRFDSDQIIGLRK